MLSKKMAFSLTSLITILVLAFVVTPAMAQDFDVTLDMTRDISTAADLQVRHPGTSLTVTLNSKEAIVLPKAKVFVTTYDKMNKLVSIPEVTVSPETAEKTLNVTIPITTDVVRVEIRINEGLPAANPLLTTKSKKVEATVHLVATDPTAGPQVYAIRRAANPLVKATEATLQVIITLSEEPKEFKKGQVSVSNAEHSDPVRLEPVPENVVGLDQLERSLRRTGLLDAPPTRHNAAAIRGIINGALGNNPTNAAGLAAIEKAYKDMVSVRAQDADEIAHLVSLHIVLDTKIGVDPTSTADPPTTNDVTTIHYLDGSEVKEIAVARRNDQTDTTPTANLPDMKMPTTQGTVDLGVGGTVIIPRANFDRSAAESTHKRPNPADYANQDEFDLAEAIYDLLVEATDATEGADDQRAAYKEEKDVYDAYMALQEAIEMLEDAAYAEWQQEKLVPAAAGTSVPRIPGSNPLPATGPDGMLHEYVVTITPTYPAGKPDIVVKVNEFSNKDFPQALMYTPPTNEEDYVEGFDKLTIQVDEETHTPRVTGFKVDLPKDLYIPAGGYLIVAENKAGSAIHIPGGPTDKAAETHERNTREMQYNVVETAELPNLETFLINGTVIDVMSPHALVITEVMWGSDESLSDPAQSQWIELYNAGAAYKTGEKANATSLIFYSPGDPLPLKSTVKDRIGTIDVNGIYWGNQLPGQRGRTGTGEAAGTLLATTPTKALISMNRVMTGGVLAADGQDSMSWASHTDPGVNFGKNAVGIRYASPGAERIITASETAAAQKARLDAAQAIADAKKAAQEQIASTGTWPLKGDGRVYISEIMFAGGGTLPQWIEIANGDRAKEFNLSGWTLTVDNAAADTDAAASSATFTIPDGTTISPSAQHDTPSTVLIVTEGGRTNIDDGTGDMGADQIINLAVDNEVELIGAGILKGKYALLSGMAFKVTLSPPKYEAMKAPAGETAAAKKLRQANEKKERTLRAEAVDTGGNLGDDGTAAWALPMSEGGARSSIIRRHLQVTRGPASPEDGMMEASWVLASETSFAQVTHIRAQSYYGAANDVGTPGFRAGGALPVELSSFRPARDKVTDAVVITWATESELNNAGFFIKRSNQPNGEFKVVNATMIPGAGTTSEKQFYTYTDTTAQPNVVYYYQIEDVSLDGNRQTLTRGIRLKGHVGAAGKATVIWGELKTSHE